MNRIKKLRPLWAAMLFVISLLLVAAGGIETVIGASIMSSVGTGLFTGMVIWFFVIYIPERNKRKILRNSMDRCYRSFRRSVLMILCKPLWGEAPALEELQDYRKFGAFFGQGSNKHWYVIVDFLRDNPYYIGEILHEMDILCREATHVRNNIDIQDPEVHNFLGGIVRVLSQFQNSHLDYSSDDLKPFMRCLFGIFAQWNFHDGQMDKDPIQTMIDEI